MSDATPFRATHAGRSYEQLRPLPVTVLLDNVRSLYNVGAFFRTVDGAGAERLILGGITGRPPHKSIEKTALGAQEAVAWEHHWDPLRRLDELREGGYEIAAVETAAHAVDLFDWEPQFPVCLVFGNEVEGIREEILGKCDTFVRIPMLGTKQSLNVAVAGGVALYELLRKYRRLSENAGK